MRQREGATGPVAKRGPHVSAQPDSALPFLPCQPRLPAGTWPFLGILSPLLSLEILILVSACLGLFRREERTENEALRWPGCQGYAKGPWEYGPWGLGDIVSPSYAISNKQAPPDSQPLPLGQGSLGLCITETLPEGVGREGSWEANRLRGHMGIRLGPRCQPGRGPGVLDSGLLPRSWAFTGDTGLGGAPGRHALGRGRQSSQQALVVQILHPPCGPSWTEGCLPFVAQLPHTGVPPRSSRGAGGTPYRCLGPRVGTRVPLSTE